MTKIDPLEKVWGDLLSRDKEFIKRAYLKLDQESKENVRRHLNAMSTEKSWHKEQKKSARIALQIINSL